MNKKQMYAICEVNKVRYAFCDIEKYGAEVFHKMLARKAYHDRKSNEEENEDCGDFTQATFLKIASRYVDFDMMGKFQSESGYKAVKGNGRKVVQSWMDKAGFDFRMYGSADELADNLILYKGFTGSHEYFGLNPGEPYNYLTRSFGNDKMEEFICKQDQLFSIQKNFLCWTELGHNDAFYELMKSMNVLIVKNASEKLGSSWETVFVDKDEIDLVFRDFARMLVTAETENGLPEVTFDPPSDRPELFEEYYFKELRNMIPGEWKNEDFDRMRFFLKRLLRDQPPKENMEYYHRVLRIAKVYVDAALTLIEENPKYFRLDSEVKSDTEPVVSVPLFLDGELKFTILDDLLHLDGMRTPNPSRTFYTVSLDDSKKFLERVKYQFIIYHILRSKHRAVPIRSLTGAYCILAEDALIEFLRPVFFQLKLFQRLKKEEWPIVEQYFTENIVPLFNLKIGETDPMMISFYMNSVKHFVRLDAMEKLKRQTFNHFSEIAKRPAKEIRNVRKDGFTVEHLKNELKYLGLLDIFPDILNYAKMAYSKVVSSQGFLELRTCDMFDAVENCQLAALIRKFPLLNEFTCKEMVCERIFNPENSQCLHDPLDFECSGKDGKDDDEDPTDGPKDQHPVVKAESSRKKKKISKTKKDENESPALPFKSIGINTVESGHCKKCFRASQLCDEAKKELKLSQNQVEKLSKKLREAERNAEDFDEKRETLKNEIEEKLKKKYHEMEKKWQEKLEEMRATVTRKEIMTVELRREIENQKLSISALETELKEKTQLIETQRKIEYPIETPPTTPTIQSTSRNELSREMKDILFDMQSTRNRLLNQSTAQKANKRAHTLILKATDPYEKGKAKMELAKFCDNYQKYMKTLEDNINKIQSNVNITKSEILKIPEFPKFSEDFEKAFKRIVNTKDVPKTSRAPEWSIPKVTVRKSGELDDKECVICLQEMDTDGETMKCQHCTRRYHTPCALSWLQKKTCCPMCNRTLLDPVEFPPIS